MGKPLTSHRTGMGALAGAPLFAPMHAKDKCGCSVVTGLTVYIFKPGLLLEGEQQLNRVNLLVLLA